MSTEVTIKRPEGVSDGRWAAIQVAMHKIATGHFPWCTDHEGDVSDAESYCKTRRESRMGDFDMSTGTITGEPLIWADLKNGKGNLHEMTPFDALTIASELERIAVEAQQAPFESAVKA